MGFFSFLNIFSSSSKETESSQQEKEQIVLPGTQLFFDALLIKNLKDDHQTLLSLYGEMAQALSDNDHKTLVGLFTKFSAELRSHLLTENLKLYIYLSHAMVADTESLAIITDLRSEMQQIGRVVNNFLIRYSELPWSEEQVHSFPSEFEKIGEVLVDRIKREEATLYPLYMHPDAYLKVEDMQ